MPGPSTPASGECTPFRDRRRYVWGWVAALAILLLVLLGGIPVVVMLLRSVQATHTPVMTDTIAWPQATSFMQRWTLTTEGNGRWSGAMSARRPPPGLGVGIGMINSEGISLPVPQDNQMVIAVHVPDGVAPSQATMMELQVCSLVRTIAGDALPTRGVPYVQCFLDARQTAYVAQNDVPPALIVAMRDAARKAGWKAMPQGVSTLPQIIEIDPAPFFPPPVGTGPPVQPTAPR